MSDIINLKFERPKLWIAAGSVGRGLKATALSISHQDDGGIEILAETKGGLSSRLIIDFTQEEAERLSEVIASQYIEDIAIIYRWLKEYATLEEVTFDTARECRKQMNFSRAGCASFEEYEASIQKYCLSYINFYNL